MKLNHPLITKVAGLVSVSAIRAWMGTLDFKIAYYDPMADLAHRDQTGPKIYLLWHEYIVFPIYLRGRCNTSILLSRHSDADILAETVQHLGFDTVRGSTFDGGTAAIRELARKARKSNLGMTPDGPRGPRRVMAQGPIYLASKLRMPIVCMAFGYDRPWRTNTWIGLPFRGPIPARSIFSPAITIPRNLDRDGLEHYRLEMEQLMNRLTFEAEAWAESGTSKIGELPFRRQPLGTVTHRSDAAHQVPAPRHRSIMLSSTEAR